MSQIEHSIRGYLSKHPEIEKSIELINRRKLARTIIDQGYANKKQFEAIVAALRRYNFKKYDKEEKNIFKNIRIRVKDDIILLDCEKKGIDHIKKIFELHSHNSEGTLKIVVGSESVKIFIDKQNLKNFKSILSKIEFKESKSISEISLLFPKDAIKTKGIISYITRELYINDITIKEILTASPELLIYLGDEFVVEAYKIIQRLKT